MIEPSVNKESPDGKDIFQRYCEDPKLRLRVDAVYTYQENLLDIPFDVVLGNADFKAWHAETCRKQQEMCDRIPLSKPISFDYVKEYENQYGRMKEYRLNWGSDNPLHGSVFGGTLAMPKEYDPNKPLIIFVHGHGMVRNYSGELRSDLFAGEDLANEVIKRGYVLWAPDNVFHDELMPLYKEHDFSDMWAIVINQTWELLKAKKALPATRHRYAIGLAAGGTTALSMTLANKEIDGLVASGVFFPLDLTRRDYRIKGHPMCHDFRRYASYLPLYAMALDRPLQVQMGRDDCLWAGHIALPSEWFTGLKRPVLTEESLGPIYILERLSKQFGNEFSFKLSSAGHERMDFEAAFGFINAVEEKRRMARAMHR